MIVAGIDPSLTNTGIAILTNGQPTRLHSIGFGGRDGANYDQRSQRIVAQCQAVIKAALQHPHQQGAHLRIDLAVIEGPAYGHNLPSNHDRAGLWWGLYSALRAKHIPTAVIAPATRAKWEQHACTTNGGCTQPATRHIEFHNLDHCNQDTVDGDTINPFGNLVFLLCQPCLATLARGVRGYLHRLNRYGRATCATCGAPAAELTDIIREDNPL